MHKHVRLFVNLFGFKYCIIGRDIAIADLDKVIPAFAVVHSQFPMLSLEVTDHA